MSNIDRSLVVDIRSVAVEEYTTIQSYLFSKGETFHDRMELVHFSKHWPYLYYRAGTWAFTSSHQTNTVSWDEFIKPKVVPW